jgi:hypothetical protein
MAFFSNFPSMKRRFYLSIVLFFLCFSAMSKPTTLKISIGSQVFYANILPSESASALVKQLPFTLSMVELNGNEKYAELKQALPTNTESVGKIQAGDLLLYGNNVLVLFYESFSTPYRYTRIGKLTETVGLEKALGAGNCQVKFELNP